MSSRGTLRIIRADHLHRVPWKNGGGSTAELAVHPPGAGLDGFGWRLSMADVQGEGPFSSFPGIDRTLVLLHGDGLLLELNGTRRRVDETAPILSFSGDSVTTAKLTGGSVRDLNVMTRRGHFSHSVAYIEAGSVEVDQTTLLLATARACTVTHGNDVYRLAHLDALLITPPLRVVIDTAVLQVRITAVL